MDEENQSPTPEEPAPDHDGPCGSQNSGSPEVPPVGQNLQIVEDDDEDNTFNNTSEEEAAEMGQTIQPLHLPHSQVDIQGENTEHHLDTVYQ